MKKILLLSLIATCNFIPTLYGFDAQLDGRFNRLEDNSLALLKRVENLEQAAKQPNDSLNATLTKLCTTTENQAQATKKLAQLAQNALLLNIQHEKRKQATHQLNHLILTAQLDVLNTFIMSIASVQGTDRIHHNGPTLFSKDEDPTRIKQQLDEQIASTQRTIDEIEKLITEK